MASIADIEAGLVARIGFALPDLRVEAVPELPDDWRMHHSKGVVLVMHRGSLYQEPLPTDVIVQERVLSFGLSVFHPHLRTHVGAYGVLEALRLVLLGFVPAPGCRKGWLIRDDFTDYDGKLWRYRMIWATSIPVVEEAEDDLPVLLKRLTMIDDYNRGETVKNADGTITQEEFPP